MKSLIRCGATAVAVALVVAVAAPAFAANITVGEFVQRVAIVKSLDATDARVATDSLRTAVALKAEGGSMAMVPSTCRRWFWTISLMAPELS